MNVGIWLLLFLEPICTYLRARRGARRYHEYNDFYDFQRNVNPSKLIRKHFGLNENSMLILTYKRYILTYILFVRIFVLYIAALFLKFNFLQYCVIVFITTGIIFLLAIPHFIMELWIERKSSRERKKQRPKKSLKDSIREFKDSIRGDVDFFRKMKQYNVKIKAQEWIIPLTKELNRCVRKQRGKKYICLKDIEYVENRILSKYQKYSHHKSVLDEQGKRRLLVYANYNQQLIFQVDIKK